MADSRDIVVGNAISITINGTDVSNYVTNLTKEQNLCSGIGIMAIRLSRNSPVTPTQGQTIRFYENGSQTGLFTIGTVSLGMLGEYQIGAQDNSKWMQDYFVAKMYTTGGGSSRYWIGFFLDLAKVSYNFNTVSYGYTLPPYDSVGFENTYEIVVRMCQLNGWYFYFDGSGVCQIGSLTNTWSSPDYTLKTSDEKVLSEVIDSNDDQLRNRVVVWGGAPFDGESNYNTVYTQIDTQTPWNRDAGDDRTIVYQNNYITDYGTAWTIAKKLHDEYSRTISIKTYQVSGYVDAEPGDVIYCETKVFEGSARLTSKIVEASSNGGYVTTLILDERCPRLFAYWSIGDEYVYASTEGAGVWRKPLSTSTWENYSTGLTNLDIRDLIIKNGLFACTSGSYQVYWRRIVDGSWTLFSPYGFYDEDEVEYDLENLVARGCAIDEATGDILYGFTDPTNIKSWVVRRYPNATFRVTLVNDLLHDDGYELNDVDTNGSKTIVTATAKSSIVFTPPPMVRSSGWEFGNHSQNAWGEYEYSLDHYTEVPDEITTTTSDYIWPNTCWDGTYLYYGNSNGRIVQWDIENDTTTDLLSSLNNYAYAIIVVDVGVVVAVHYQNSTSITAKLVNFNTSIVSTIGTYTNGNGLDYWHGGIGFVDTAGDSWAAWIILHDNASGTKDNIKVYWYNYTTGTVSIDTITPTFNANTNVGDVYAFGRILHVDNTYASSVATFNCTAVGAGDYAETGILLHFDLENQSVTHTLLEDVDASPTEFYCYWGAYDPTQERFYFVLDDYLGSSNVYIWTVDKDGTDQGQTDRTSEFGVQESVAGVVASKDAGYLVIRDSSDDSARVVYAYSFSNAKTGIDSYKICAISNDRASVPEFYYVTTAGALYSTQSGLIKNTTIDGTKQLWSTIYGKYFHCFDRQTKKMHLLKATSDGETERYYTLVQYVEPVPSLVSGEVAKNFELRETFTYPMDIEISRDAPIVYYGGTTEGDGTGQLWVSAYATSGDFWVSPNLINSATLKNMNFYADARVIDVLGLASTEDVGWTYTSDITSFARRVFATRPSIDGAEGGLYFRDAYQYFESWDLFTTFSGSPHRIESTNYVYPTPYLFVSISGAPSTFWQLDPGYTEEFVDRSINLPSFNITRIRCDDRI